jgi:hnRNP-L/PTB/hephaestus splicing factor
VGGFDSKVAYSGGSFNPYEQSFQQSPQPQQGTVLLVNNLTPDKVTPTNLFTLFGVYGDVLRVKILFKKRDTALIQFANSQGAHNAQLHLNRLFLHSKEITVNQSKHTEISMPRGDTEEAAAAFTKDFSNSPIHRFKNSRSGGKNINPPSSVLHISNLNENSITEEELRKLFGEEQNTAPVVQFFSNRKMAYVKMDTVHDAVLALMRLHNHKLHDRYMRVSFSPKDPSQVSNSDSAEGATGAGDER